jgi:hypothetical protein
MQGLHQPTLEGHCRRLLTPRRCHQKGHGYSHYRSRYRRRLPGCSAYGEGPRLRRKAVVHSLMGAFGTPDYLRRHRC